MKNQIDDRKMMEDARNVQNYITTQYNDLSNQCGATPVKMALLNLLGDEHRIQHEVFSEIHRRGWKKTENADTEEIQKVCQWVESQGGTEGPVRQN